ncbi:MAG: helix-turn-helix domain-containing protein [Actinomycetota bacterium]|nr:helix-turn-helix domain-containing protein [Actinomycetota bacterium]
MGPTGADLIVEARRRAGLTQRELAERAGTTQSSIARWESARSEPSFANVIRLLRLCGFVLDVHLELYDDGLRDDWSQAQRLLRLTPEERIESNTHMVDIARDLRAAALAAGLA